jgi:hypothetical protein
MTVWKYSETSSHSGQRNDDCMPTCCSGELRCTEDRMVTIRFIRWGLEARPTLTANGNLWSYLLITRALMSRSLQTCFMMEISSHKQISDMSFGGPNIHEVRIELCLHSKHGEPRHLWVSVVYGWAGVAGHLVEFLSRICLLRFSLSSCSSCDRARWCRRYFRIWK